MQVERVSGPPFLPDVDCCRLTLRILAAQQVLKRKKEEGEREPLSNLCRSCPPPSSSTLLYANNTHTLLQEIVKINFFGVNSLTQTRLARGLAYLARHTRTHPHTC